jgi:hypothetical protein
LTVKNSGIFPVAAYAGLRAACYGTFNDITPVIVQAFEVVDT